MSYNIRKVIMFNNFEGENFMKNKTMLKFLLCFFIIGCLFNVKTVDAACNHETETVISIDYKNTSKHVITYQCDDCGRTREKQESHEIEGETYISTNNGYHTKIKKCSICRESIESFSSACNTQGDIVYKSNGNKTHYEVKTCSRCGFLAPITGQAPVSCSSVQTGISKGDVTNHLIYYKCDKCKTGWSEEKPHQLQGETTCYSNNDGTHSTYQACDACGKTVKISTDNCNTSGEPKYVPKGNKEHYILNSCSECSYSERLTGNETSVMCTGVCMNKYIHKNNTTHSVYYNCVKCNQIWTLDENHNFADNQCTSCGIKVIQSAGPSAKSFFEPGWNEDEKQANKEKVKKAYDVIDGGLSPVLHIQSLIMMLGTIAAVIVMTIYGIQWVMANAAKRQDLKAGLWPLAIGVILLVIGPRLVILIVKALL